jgi:hypothetical protein
MHLNYLLLQRHAELVPAKPIMNVQKKIFKLMEAWVLLGNLIAISITEDVVNWLLILAVKQFGKIN